MFKIMSLEATPFCISIPEDLEIERSKPGSIHLLPYSPKDITESEWNYIYTAFPQLKAVLLPMPQAKPVKTAPMKPAVKPEPEEPDIVAMTLEKPISTIMEELQEKKVLMGWGEYQELVQQLVEGEESGDYNRESPRATLLKKLRIELEN